MTASVPTILKYLSDNNNNSFAMDFNDGAPQRAKKRRLDHLSWDEKIQRKKLKNRVAAQTSRDRKKAKMEQMEGALQELFAKNESLVEECEKLRLSNEQLSQENAELTRRLQTPCASCAQNRSVVCEAGSGPAESLLRPQGTATHSAALLGGKEAIRTALWKTVLACLLYRTCSTSWKKTSTCSPWSNSHSPYSKISPEIWRTLLKKQLIKNQTVLEKFFQDKWWGRHQNNWNPVETKG